MKSNKRSLVLFAITILCAHHSMATVVGWGTNDYGQITIPSGLVGARAVAAGYWHNLAVTSSRKVIAWGLNDYGQTNVPAGLSNVVAVAAGHDHSLALKTNGVVVGWGDDTFGQIDIPVDLTNGTSFASAIAAGAFHSMALRRDGTVEAWGYDFYGETDPPANLTNAIAIACGNAFSVALRSDGTVVAWGDDYYGQTDVPADLTNVLAIAAGGFHALALKNDGTIVAWGSTNGNSGAINFGQAAVPADLTNAVALAGGYFHSLALRSDGVVEQWGDTSLGQTNPPSTLSRVLSIAGGYAHNLALEDDTPVILAQPADVATNVGKLVKLTLLSTGTFPMTNRWYRFNGATNILVTTSLSSSVTNGILTSSVTVSNALSNTFYFGVVSNASGMVTSRVVTLSVVAPPSITNQPQNVVVVVGSTVFFSVTAGGTVPLSYQWLFNGVDTGAGSVNPLELDNVTTNNSGSYRVIITNNYGSVTSQVATLTVGDGAAIATQPTNKTVVLGSDATFSVGAVGADPLSYQWWFNDTNLLQDATNSAYTVSGAQATDAGGYSVVVANAFGSATSLVATLTVILPPTIQTSPTDVATNSGKPVRLILTATGSFPMTNRWWQVKTNNGVATNALILSGVTASSTNGILTSTLTISSASNALYFGVVSNAAGMATSSLATVTIVLPPTITNQPQNVVTIPGATVFFSVTAGGTPPLTYQWLYNGLDAGAGSTNRLQLDNVTTNNNGSYQVIVGNSYGSVTSQVATLTVGDAAAIATQPTNKTVVLGTNATFSVVAAGAEPLSYQWWFNQTNLLQDATNSSYTINGATTNDAGGYNVIVANEFGSATSLVANLTVLLPPTIQTQPTDVATNSGKQVRLTLAASGSFPMTNRWWQIKTNNGVATNALIVGNTFTSTTNGVLLSTLVIPSALSNAVYFGVVSNSAGMVTSSVAAVTIVLPPAITSQPQNIATNPTSTVLFSVGVSGTPPFSYQWLYNGLDSGAGSVNPLELDNVTTNNNGQYQVIVSNNYGAVTSQVAVLVVGFTALTPAQLYLLAHSGANGDTLMMVLEAGKNYRIQSSSNLQDWSDVTNFLSTTPLVEYTNQLSTNLDSLFYRVVSP